MILTQMAPKARVGSRLIEFARLGALLTLVCVFVFDLALIPL